VLTDYPNPPWTAENQNKKSGDTDFDICGLDDDTHEYGGDCSPEECPKKDKFRWEPFHTHCKYRNRDYGPPSGAGRP
jgi:hypothetical protein